MIRLGIVLVSYNPGIDHLERVIRKFTAPSSIEVVVVDNSPESDVRAKVFRVCSSLNCSYVTKERNIGIAAAQNVGIQKASERGAEYVLLLDQDSDFALDSILDLLNRFHAIRVDDERVVAVGPLCIDSRDGAVTVAHVGRFGPTIRRSVICGPEVIVVPYLIASGTILHVRSYFEIGVFREDYFIDGVDVEWGMRATLSGRLLLVFGAVQMNHELAKIETSLLGKKIRVPGTPERRYYRTRNNILLLRDLRIPGMWRVGILGEIARSLISSMARSGWEFDAIRLSFRGLIDGLTDSRGEIDDNNS